MQISAKPPSSRVRIPVFAIDLNMEDLVLVVG
ncbi:hypothetical protein ABIF55_000337 [Bradyrhizobium diazoefficiens]